MHDCIVAARSIPPPGTTRAAVFGIRPPETHSGVILQRQDLVGGHILHGSSVHRSYGGLIDHLPAPLFRLLRIVQPCECLFLDHRHIVPKKRAVPTYVGWISPFPPHTLGPPRTDDLTPSFITRASRGLDSGLLSARYAMAAGGRTACRPPL